MGRGEQIYKSEFDSKVRWLIGLGCTNVMAARQLGVTEVCFYSWKKKHPSFEKACRAGFFDALESGAGKKEAEESLRAIGLFVEAA